MATVTVENLICQQCGGQYRRESWKAGRFCSPYCRSRVWAKAQAGAIATCQQCGAEYARDPRKVGRYCSLRCSGLARRKRTPRPCLFCQSVFTPHPSNPGKYCSTVCHDNARRVPAVTRRCALTTCGKAFEVSRANARRGGGKFCDRACWKASRALPRGGRRQAPCRTCGQLREYFTSELTRGRGKYCSRVCWALSHQSQRASLTCEACRKDFARPPSHAAARFCSRRCYDRTTKLRGRSCRVCREPLRAEQLGHRGARFCSLACTNKGRRRRQAPGLSARNRRILQLHGAGLKSPEIQVRLSQERAEWWAGAALIRKVISLATRVGMDRERKFTLAEEANTPTLVGAV